MKSPGDIPISACVARCKDRTVTPRADANSAMPNCSARCGRAHRSRAATSESPRAITSGIADALCVRRSPTTRYRDTVSANAGLRAAISDRARSRCISAAPAVVTPSARHSVRDSSTSTRGYRRRMLGPSPGPRGSDSALRRRGVPDLRHAVRAATRRRGNRSIRFHTCRPRPHQLYGRFARRTSRCGNPTGRSRRRARRGDGTFRLRDRDPELERSRRHSLGTERVSARAEGELPGVPGTSGTG